MRRFLTAAILLMSTAATIRAAVTRVDIIERGEFPAYPGYERIIGKIHCAVDPRLTANRVITDIALAPRNAKGLVEFTADLFMLKPIDATKGNQTALFEVSNRGGRGMLGMFDLGGKPDPHTAQDMGDPLLFQQGFTLVWVGWEWDVPKRPGVLGLDAPRIPSLTGLVRAEIIRNERAHHVSLGDRAQTPYPVADEATATMTWRDDPTAPGAIVPRSQWHIVDGGTAVDFDPGFVPGRIYEVIYKAQAPVVEGLGAAGIRDYISYLKQTGVVKRAIGFGTSQSGRYLRDFVYQGFNADEKGAQVFDGVWAHVGGAGRGSFNIRFGQPSRDGHARLNLFYPTDIFPFSDLPQTDSGVKGSLLARTTAKHLVPKIFYTNGSYEYWGRGAALIHITVDGKRDFVPGTESRIYYIAGTQHGPAANPVRHNTENLANPQDYRFALRALLLAMNAWITNNTAPPDSRLPLIARNELVSPAKLNFPQIPGVHLPKEPYTVYRLNFGPDFRARGIIGFEPPRIGKPFPALVPQVDADGNETAGIRLPEQMVPLATYTGWNLRDTASGAPSVLYDMVGSFLPFPRTRAEREKTGDPRLSIEERYPSREDYLQKVGAAAEALAGTRLLLASDVPKIVERAAARWDSLMNSAN
jgi:hypothetical protein